MKKRLLTPGPTPVSPEVAAAMAAEMLYHRALKALRAELLPDG